ncbi:MAG: ankyrin repeat domain-containing protein [Gammaproteobacteria bacterium]|nr:ankyrin repeat domain-containing protein [Gammaproteobacteria bacterium]
MISHSAFLIPVLVLWAVVSTPVDALDYGDSGTGASESGDFGAAAAEPVEQPEIPEIIATQKTPAEQWASAIANDDTEQLITLFETHEAPQTLLSHTASNGKTALMVACKTGELPLAKTLVAAGANLKQKTVTGGTAFMFAVLGNELDAAQWLYDQGVDVQAQGSNGWSAVTIAAAKGSDELLRWLISIGADANAPDVYRFSPLMRAVDNGHVDVVKVLLSAEGIDIDQQDERNNTALHYAVAANRTDLVSLLLDAGASSDLQNREGETAKTMAQDEAALLALFQRR